PLHTSKLAGINITGTNLNVFTGITTIGGGTVTILLSGSSPSGVAVFNNNAQINSDGAVSITASTSMTTGGGITTTNDAITIDATVFLTNSVVIDSGSVGAPVLYTKTIDCLPANTHALTINAGISGTITVQGSVGKTTALRSLTLENSNGVQFGTIDADWLVASDYVRVQYAQNNANVVFNGAMVTDSFNALTGPYSVNLAGHESVIGTADFQNIQQAIFGNASTDVLLFLSALTVLTPSVIELFGEIRTRESAVTLGDYNTPIYLRGADSVIDTTNGGDPSYSRGATITFGGFIEGSAGTGNENLDFNSGTDGDIVYMRDIGGSRRVGTMYVRNGRNMVYPNITAQSVIQIAGTGTTTFNGVVNTTSATGVDITTTNIVLNNLITTIVNPLMTDSAPGIVNLQATGGTASATTGIITMLDPGRIVAANDVSIRGNRNVVPAILVYEATPAGPDLTPQTRDFITTTTLGADVLIESSINFISPGETANNNFIINTKAANGNITLQGAIDGNWNNFVLISGTGTVATTAAAPMTEVATLTLQDNSGLSNGTINLNASIAVDWIEVFPQNYAVNILGSSNTVGVRSYYKYGNTQHPVFHNTGGVRFGDDATDYIWFRERLTSVASTTTVTGVIEANFTIAFGN
ncbi:MAG: hypothetical protein ACK56X_07335, partial [Planctomyces sp.]